MNKNLRSIKSFTAEGLAPPTTLSETDHQGGGMGRVAQWDGKKWVAKSPWLAADQEMVWNMIRQSSAEFKKSGT